MKGENIYIFEGLSKEEVSYFILMSETCFFKKGEAIINQGDESNDKAYLIERGSTDIIIDGEKVATLKEGDLFGEIALIVNEPRTATVVAGEDTEVLTLDKENFLMLYQKSGQYQSLKDKILERIKNNFYGIKE